MRDNWQLFSGTLPIEMCNDMIKNFKKLPTVDGGTFNNDDNHRRSSVRWVTGEHGLEQILLRYVNLANATAFNVDIQQEMNEMQFGEYSAEYAGKYDWHHDIDWNNAKNFDRKLSVVVQLSNPRDYEGGEFQFSEVESPSSDLWSKQGSILVFPSYLTHRVTEVTSGVRYSLVSWIRGPRWR
jgi:PKHD-type hydroxylase